MLWYAVVSEAQRFQSFSFCVHASKLEVNWAYVHAYGQTQDWDLSAQLAAGLHVGCHAPGIMSNTAILHSCSFWSCVYCFGSTPTVNSTLTCFPSDASPSGPESGNFSCLPHIAIPFRSDPEKHSKPSFFSKALLSFGSEVSRLRCGVLGE